MVGTTHAPMAGSRRRAQPPRLRVAGSVQVKPRSLAMRTRGMVAFGLLAFLVSIVVAATTYELARSTLIAQRERGATRQTFLNARSVLGALSGDSDQGAAALDRVQTASGGTALLRVDGEWFSTSVSLGRNDVPESLLAAVNGGSVGRQRIATSTGPAVAVGVPLAGTENAYVEFVPFAEVDSALSTVGRGATVVVVLATAVGVLLGRSLTGRVLRPVRRTAEAATLIHEGALDRRLASESDADLRPLVDSFNLMVDGLQERIEREARFSSDVGHELRSPLATMTAALSLARRQTVDGADTEALDLLDREVSRFRGLIVDLLEIARAEAGGIELAMDVVDPAVLVSSVLESTHRSDVDLVVRAGTGDQVRLDKRRIGQSLVNLLDNADNYGGGATAVTVDGDADVVRFVVDDCGPGVPESERAYIFGRFARGAAAASPGTGLGLALVAEHARLHDGSVWVEDAPEGGARFVIAIRRLPL